MKETKTECAPALEIQHGIRLESQPRNSCTYVQISEDLGRELDSSISTGIINIAEWIPDSGKVWIQKLLSH